MDKILDFNNDGFGVGIVRYYQNTSGETENGETENGNIDTSNGNGILVLTKQVTEATAVINPFKDYISFKEAVIDIIVEHMLSVCLMIDTDNPKLKDSVKSMIDNILTKIEDSKVIL